MANLPLILSWGFLILASSILFARLHQRPVVAAIEGIVSGTSLGVLALISWASLDFANPGTVTWPAVMLTLMATNTLIISLIISRKTTARAKRWPASMILGLSLQIAASLLAFIPISIRYAHVPIRKGRFTAAELSPNRKSIIAVAANSWLGSSQIWLIPLDGSSVRRLTARLTMDPLVSPDNRWMTYVSQRRYCGLRTERVSMRAMGIDGRRDWIIAKDLWCDNHWANIEVPFGGWAFSPDSRQLAALTGGDLILARSDRSSPIVQKIGEPTAPQKHLIGWTQDGAEILFLSGGQIQAWNPELGRFRPICSVPGAQGPRSYLLLTQGHGTAGVKHALIGNQLIDVSKGTSTTLPSDRVESAGMSLDQKALVYVTAGDSRNFIIRWREIASGSDRIVDAIQGEPRSVLVSPSGAHAAIVCWPDWQTTLIKRDGLLGSLVPGWRAIGWADDQRLVLLEETRHPASFAIMHIATDHLVRIYP